MHRDNYATCVPLLIASFLHYRVFSEPSVFDYCNRYRAMCDNRKTRNTKRSDAPAGVDIRTLLCPVKNSHVQVHQQLPRVQPRIQHSLGGGGGGSRPPIAYEMPPPPPPPPPPSRMKCRPLAAFAAPPLPDDKDLLTCIVGRSPTFAPIREGRGTPNYACVRWPNMSDEFVPTAPPPPPPPSFGI